MTVSQSENTVASTYTKSKMVSIVIPILNEADILPELVRRLAQTLEGSAHYRWEVILVNDGSSDDSEKLMTMLVQQHSWLTAVHLSRNFGHQTAISAGMDLAHGDAVIVMDGDLQDPPEVIPKLLAKWEEGYAVVYATRQHREGEHPFKQLTAALFYRLLQRWSDVPIPLDTGDFRLMDRSVVNALSQMREHNRFVRGMVSWVGFPQTPVYYERDRRFEGRSKFTLLKMIRFALDGVMSFSKIPLQWITTLGFVISLVSFIGILLALFVKYVLHTAIIGWTSMMVVVMFLGGIQLICMGMIGEYVGRIFDEVRQRPLYLIRRVDSQQPFDIHSISHPVTKEILLYDTL